MTMDVTEHWAGRDAGFSASERRYTRVFKVWVDDITLGPLEVARASGIPRGYDPYVPAHDAPDLGALCIGIDSKQDAENPFEWLVTCKYSSQPTSYAGQDGSTASPRGPGSRAPDQTAAGQQEPNLRPAVISWSAERYQKPLVRCDKVLDSGSIEVGAPVVTSAGERFDPPITIDDNRPTLTITRNQLAFDPAIMTEYQDAVNDATWFGYAEGTVKCFQIAAQSEYENGIFFWQVTYVFHIQRDGWDLEIIDQGFYQRDADTGELIEIILKGGLPASPVWLDGLGFKMDDEVAAEGEPVYLTFRPYVRKNFNVLNLP